MIDSKLVHVLGATLVLLLPLAACGGGEADGEVGGLSGMVTIDGSSTVFPISEAMAEEFQIANRGVRVTVGISGTGGGFKKFCSGETDISDASRPANDWATCMTVGELTRVCQPGSSISSWNQLRPEWPDEEIKLYGPDTDSGTFDYFTKAIVGEEDASRDDYTASADDNVLVVGVGGDRGSLGYFGFAYYEESSDILGAVAVDNGEGCVLPDRDTIENGTYAPLSRPMFIYTKAQALAKPQVRAFLQFYLDNATLLVAEVGYVPLAEQRYAELLGTVRAN